MSLRIFFLLAVLGSLLVRAAPSRKAAGGLRAGAAAVDITPSKFPVIVSGGFLAKTATQAYDRLFARAVVLDDGATQVVLCVIDTCMMPRELIDAAKTAASGETGIPTARMMVSATHTHSAPSVMGILGTPIDPDYTAFLPKKITEAIVGAARKLAPARIGSTSVDAWELTNCRRWIRRPDKILPDPFGQKTVRANMHPGYQNPDVTGPAGPIDPELSLLLIQAVDGKPMALFANFSMHYFGGDPLSADYFGRFAENIGRMIGAGSDADFVGIISQGTSGDSQWMDYSRAKTALTRDEYADALLRTAAAAVKEIEFEEAPTLAMAQAQLRLKRRVPDAARRKWAESNLGAVGDRLAANRFEVYAREQMFLAAEPERELTLQALRIGRVGIAAIPNEVYAITGLKIKAQSPLRRTFNVELANGAEGYIPPPEQHGLGGYTTWPARTAALEVEAEPKIVESILGLLETVAGEKRRDFQDTTGPYARAILASQPAAYWRLEEIRTSPAADASGNRRAARYEPGVAFYLPGAQMAAHAISAQPENPSAFSGPRINRAPHFAGGRVRAEVPGLRDNYSIEFWLWNALPSDVRAVTGYLFSRGKTGSRLAEHLGIGGTRVSEGEGKLFFRAGEDAKETVVGRTRLEFRKWHHVALVRSGSEVRVHLDGGASPDLIAVIRKRAENDASLAFGGQHDYADDTFEGRMDEIAVFTRALSPDEIRRHYLASMSAGQNSN